MRKNKRIAATLILLFLIGLVLTAAAKNYYSEGRKKSFQRLTEYTKEAGQNIQKETESDREYLKHISKIIAQGELADSKRIRTLLSGFGNMGTLSRVEVLLPNDEMLTEKGLINTSGKCSFQDISKKGIHISRRSSDLLDQDKMVLRHYMPVKKNGQTIAVLCGVMDLAEWPKKFSIQGYGAKMQLYVLEGDTGDFLMDTWRGSLENMHGFDVYTLKKGYSEEQINSDFAKRKAGVMVFYSKDVPGYYYSRYLPVGVEDWMVMLTVPENVAFAQTEKMLHSFYILAVMLLVIFFLYLFWILWEIKKDKEESNRQLRNVKYMLEVEKVLFDAHVRSEHFAAALQKVAEFLEAQAAFFWMTDTRSSLRQRLWTSQNNQATGQDRGISDFLADFFSVIQKKEGVLCYEMETFYKQLSLDREKYSRFQINSLMLIPVTGLDGKLSMILGAYNMKRRWETTDPLKQVSLSFSMAINHYEAYQSLIKMGQVDSLTGLMNRNSFHADMEKFMEENYRSLACIYMDANGLHEINNHLGHQAGDQMLKAVAEALRVSFRQSRIYRIGGDEFVVLCRDQTKESVESGAKKVRAVLTDPSYEVSIGIEWRDKDFDLEEMINAAENAMQKDKQSYYRENGNERQIRYLDKRIEQMILEKQDADTFLSVLAPEFKGVYFVNLGDDTIRHLYIPTYFEQYLKEADDIFSDALLIYARSIVKSEYFHLFEQFCDYEYLEKQLNTGCTPEFVYQKTDGQWIRLRVLKFKHYTEKSRETLWIFSNIDE